VEVLKIFLTTRLSVKALATVLGVGLCLTLIVAALVFGGVFASNDAPPQDDPVLVGAGDIADFTNADEVTAALIRDYSGTVFTLGDNAYGTAKEEPFDLYYEPTWGTEKSRTMPIPGNRMSTRTEPSTSTTLGRWPQRTMVAPIPTSAAIGISSP